MKTTRVKHEKKATGIVGDYLNSLRAFPQLKHPELVELFQTYERGGSAANVARKRLIECNLRLVVSIAKQYNKAGNIPMEDLIQEGNVGLMKAIERFKWDKGYRFSTYASWWIKQSIGQHVLKRRRIIRLPAHAANVQRKLIQAAEEYRNMLGIEPTPEELQELVGASEMVVKATIHSGRAIISLNQPVSNNNPGDTLEDKLVDIRPEADPFDNVVQKEIVEIARNVMAKLTPKESAILRLRFGLVDNSAPASEFPITESEMKSIMRGKPLK